MTFSNFHSEWTTIRQHRILLHCRTSFPNDHMRFMAQVAAMTCDCNSEGRARVTQVFYDDNLSIWRVNIASTEPADAGLEEVLRTVFHTMLDDGNVQPEFQLVREGETETERYNRTEHLSMATGIPMD